MIGKYTWRLGAACSLFTFLGAGSAALAAEGKTIVLDDGAMVHDGSETPTDIASSDNASDNVILVQARRRGEDIQTVPVAVSAFSEEVLDSRGIVTTQDLTFVTPGLVVAPALSRDVPAFVIRGQQRLESGVGAPAVATYFADVPLSVQGSLLPTFDIQSVQVLKGPQGTLFGRNTTGGAVLVYPTAPSYDLEGYVQASYGDFDERTLEGAINIPLSDGTAALRLAGQIARRDGYTINLANGEDLDDRNTDLFRASLLLEPTDSLSNTTIFDYFEANENGTATVLTSLYPNAGVPTGGLPRGFPFNLFFDNGMPGSDLDLILEEQLANGIRTVNFDFPNRSNRELWGITNTTELDLGAVRLKNIFGFRSTFVDSSRDFDGTPLPINGQANIFSRDQITNEFQILGDLFDNNVEYIFGAFYLKETPDGTSAAGNDILVTPFNPPVFGELYSDDESVALFAHATIGLDSLLPGLELSAGFRYTWDELEGCSATGPDPAIISGSFEACKVNNPDAVTITESSAPTWSATLNYQAADDILIYLATRRGYRAAGPNGSGFADSISQFENFDEETVTDYEFGLKSQFELGNMLATFNIAVYDSDFENIQQTLLPGPDFDGDGNPVNDPFTLVINASEATIRGFELDWGLQISENLTIGGFLNHTDASFDLFTVDPALVPALGDNPTDNVFPNVPEWTAGGYIDVNIPVGGFGDFVFNANLYNSGQLNFNRRPFDTAGIEDGYTVVNARIGFENIGGSDVSARLFARNLFDEEYAAAGGFTVPTFSTGTLIFGEPRIVGVEVGFRFGS